MSVCHTSLFLKFSQVRYWQPIPPLQTASISLFPPSFQLAQAESERHVWHVNGMSPFPYPLYTNPFLLVSYSEFTVPVILAAQGWISSESVSYVWIPSFLKVLFGA